MGPKKKSDSHDAKPHIFNTSLNKSKNMRQRRTETSVFCLYSLMNLWLLAAMQLPLCTVNHMTNAQTHGVLVAKLNQFIKANDEPL